MTDGVAVVHLPTGDLEAVPHDEWEGSSSPIGTAVFASKEWSGITAVKSDETWSCLSLRNDPAVGRATELGDRDWPVPLISAAELSTSTNICVIP